MTLQPMEEYFRDRVRIEARGPEGMQATVTLTPDLQGPPEAGHGGGVTGMLFELVRLFHGDCGNEVRVPRPVKIEAILHREVPLQVPLQATVVPVQGGWVSRILRGERLVAEAGVRPMTEPLAPPAPELRGQWERSRREAHAVPGYEFCLACGLRNPRGVQVRFDYNDQVVWKRLVPQPHFRCADGSLFPGYLCIVGDEIGWWLGALRQGECGLSNRVTVCLGAPVAHDVPLLILGARSAVTTSDPKGRVWQTRAAIMTPDWQPVATTEVQFAGSRAFTKLMLPGFVPGGDRAAVERVFPANTAVRELFASGALRAGDR
jgi:hypothetical protein